MCKYKDKEWLEEMYNRDDLEIKDIADMAGCGTSYLMKHLKAYQINQSIDDYEKYHNEDFFLREHVSKNRSLREIADEIGVNRKILGIWKEELRIITNAQKIIKGMKFCSNCRTWRPISRFNKGNNTSSGFRSECIDCNRHKRRTEEVREKKRRYQKRFREENPEWRIHHAIGEGIWRSLKEEKAKKCWQDILDYDLEDLKEHLRNQFKPGMSFNNYGHWHIDHIKPRSSFDISGIDDPELKECWALDNLQPLWAEENLSKHDKIPNSANLDT